MCSGLLAYRIWLVERSVSTMRTQKTSLMPILRLLVDSAVLYTAVLFPALICFLYSNTGEVVVVDMVISPVNNKKRAELRFIRPCRSCRLPFIWCSFASQSIETIASRFFLKVQRARLNKETHSNIL